MKPAGGIAIDPARRWATDGAAYDVPHLRLRLVAQAVAGLAPSRVLDVGCGRGTLRTLLPGIAYEGCDFAPPDGTPPFPYHRCDFNREPLPEALRDLECVVCSGILEYVADLPGFLRMLRARIRPGGSLVATYFNMNHVSRIRARLAGRALPAHPDWKGMHSPRAVASMIGAAGFRVGRTIPVGGSLRPSPPVSGTVDEPARLRPLRPWSRLTAHQFLYVAAAVEAPR